MKILAIIGVRFNNNYSNVNFEGKKDKKSNASAPISSTLKAVPVALMLAMSPMVTQAQTQKELTPQESYKLAKSGQFIKEFSLKKASKEYGDCTIKFFDTDNNPQTVEFAELNFDRSDDYTLASAKIYPTAFVEDKNGFWIKGNGERFFYSVFLDKTESQKKARIAIPITEEFFNILLKVYGDELPVIRDKKVAYPFK